MRNCKFWINLKTPYSPVVADNWFFWWDKNSSWKKIPKWGAIRHMSGIPGGCRTVINWRGSGVAVERCGRNQRGSLVLPVPENKEREIARAVPDVYGSGPREKCAARIHRPFVNEKWTYSCQTELSAFGHEPWDPIECVHSRAHFLIDIVLFGRDASKYVNTFSADALRSTGGIPFCTSELPPPI